MCCLGACLTAVLRVQGEYAGTRAPDSYATAPVGGPGIILGPEGYGSQVTVHLPLLHPV